MRRGRFASRFALAALSLCAIASAETFTYWNGSERRDLVPVNGMAAIYLGSETPAELANFTVRDAGRGWYFVMGSGDGVKLADSLLSISAVKFSSPVFKADRFGYQWLKPGAMVHLKTAAPANLAARMGPVPVVSFNELMMQLPATGIRSARPLEAQFGAHLVKVELETRRFRDVLAAANQYRINSNVAAALPSYGISARNCMNTNDPLFNLQWYHRYTGQFGGDPVDWIDMKGADSFDFGFGSSAVQVMVIDDGVDQTHEDYRVGFGSDWTGSGTFGAPADPAEEHGTAMAGLIGATANNAKGIAGMGAGSSIASAKATLLTPFGVVTDPEWIANSLLWGVQRQLPLSVIGFNLGASDPTIDSAYDVASALGMTHFGPTGFDTAVGYPASRDDVIGIAGTDWLRSASGTTGEQLFAVGAGVNIATTLPGNSYGVFPEPGLSSSAATALTVGVAARMLAKNPALTTNDFLNVLAGTAEDIVDPQNAEQKVGLDTTWGWGMINAAYAVSGAGLLTVTANATEFFGGENGVARFTLMFDPLFADVLVNPTSSDSAIVNMGTDPLLFAVGDPKQQAVPFTTAGVNDVRTIRISGQVNNTIRSFNLVIKPAILSTLEAPTTINGFANTTGRVRLQGRASADTAVVALTSSRPSVITVPASITVASQQNQATFTMSAGQVAVNTEVILTASYRGVTKTRKAIVVPPTAILSSVTLSPTTVEGGQNFSATVRIAAAVANNVLVNLTENSPVVNAPTAPRQIAAGQTSTVFTVGTGEVTVTTAATITANLGAQTRTANVTVTPTRRVVSLTCTPLSVRQGFSTSVRIIVYSPAPAGGTTVTLSDNSAYATTPATAVIPAGRTFVDVVIPTAATVPSTQTVTLTGRVGTTAAATTTFSITR